MSIRVSGFRIKFRGRINAPATPISLVKIEGMIFQFQGISVSEEKKESAKEKRKKEERKEDEDSLNINFFLLYYYLGAT